MLDSATDFVPKETHERIMNYADDSLKSAPQLESELLEGTDRMPGFLKPDGGFRGQFKDNALVDAINRKALGTYQRKMGQLNQDVSAEALNMRFNRLTNAAKLVNMEHQQNERAKLNRYLDKMNRRRARAGVLGNVLGIAGAAAGAYAAGGPAGAMAGYHVGQGVGNSMG